MFYNNHNFEASQRKKKQIKQLFISLLLKENKFIEVSKEKSEHCFGCKTMNMNAIQGD